MATHTVCILFEGGDGDGDARQDAMIPDMPLEDDLMTMGEICERIAPVLAMPSEDTWPFLVYHGGHVVNDCASVTRSWREVGLPERDGLLTVHPTREPGMLALMDLEGNARTHLANCDNLKRRRLMAEQDMAYNACVHSCTSPPSPQLPERQPPSPPPLPPDQPTEEAAAASAGPTVLSLDDLRRRRLQYLDEQHKTRCLSPS